MKSHKRRLSLPTILGPFLFALLAALPACPAARADKAPPQRTTALVPFEPLRNHGVPLVQVRLNDQVTGTFMIDTGASDCLMTDDMAKRLGLKTQPAFYHGFLPLHLGEDQNDFALVNHIQMGPLLLKDAAFLVIKTDELFKFPEQHVDGIIGGTVLSRFTLFVDFPRHVVGLISPGGLSDAEVQKMGFGGAVIVPLRRERISVGGAVIPVSIDHDHGVGANQPVASLGLVESPLKDMEVNVYKTDIECRSGADQGKDSLYVDTGAPDTSISEDLAERLHLTPEDKEGASTMFNGSVFGDVGRVPNLRLGGMTMLNPLVAYPGTKGTDIPPLLGEDVLAYCVALFDFPREKLYLQPALPPIAAPPAAGASHVDAARLRQDAETFSYAPAALATPTPEDATDPPAHVALLRAKCRGEASDAGVYTQIGDALESDGQAGPAQAAYAKAVELRRAPVTAKPEDAIALAELAEALNDAGQEDEAEKIARQAVARDGGEARVWLALGRVLHARSLLALTGRNTTPDVSGDYLDYEALIAKLRSAPPTPAQQDSAQALSREAHDCFDKAVALAPADRQAYAARAEFLQDDGLGVAAVLHELHGAHVDLPLETHPAQYFTDQDRLAQLAPDDPDVLRDAALADVDAAIVRHDKGVDFREAKLWKSLPSRTRQSVQEKIDRLGALSKATAPEPAAHALVALGELQYEILGDEPLAETTLRRALTPAPGQPQACRTLARMLSAQRRYDDLAALLGDQLKHSDTALLHLLLARTLERQKHWPEAEAQVRSALKMKPDSFTANVTLATLLLRHADATADALSQAQDCLAKAQAALGTRPDRARATEFNIAVSLLSGLSGDPAAARQTILDVLADDRTNTQARDILAALVL